MKQVACLLCVTTIDCSRSSSTMLTLRPLSVIADCQICVKSSGTRERHTVSTSLPLFADPTFSTINTIKVNPAFSNINPAFHPKLQNIKLTSEYRMSIMNQLLSSQESMPHWHCSRSSLQRALLISKARQLNQAVLSGQITQNA